MITMPGPEPSDNDLKLLSLINAQEGGFGTAVDINPQTDVGEKQTRNRLNDLAKEGLLNKRKVGRANVYWLSDEGEQIISQRQF